MKQTLPDLADLADVLADVLVMVFSVGQMKEV
jgi:hypothetical protein